MHTSYRASLRAATILSVVAMPGIAFAQASPPVEAVPQPVPIVHTSNAVGAEDIIVTARKRSESLRDVPVAITALPDKILAEKNVARLSDLVTIVPTFTVNLTAPHAVASIRGFGSGGNPSFEQSVGKFVDNVSYGRDFHARIPLYDVQQVEVLKGPQVLLYGNSTTAGALNIVTKKPGGHFSLDASAAYEFVNEEVLLNGGVTVPLSDRASFRIAGFAQDLARGWIYNVGNRLHEPTSKNWGIRPTVRLEPIDGLTLTFKAEVDRIRDQGGTAQPVTQSTLPSRQNSDPTYDFIRDLNNDVAPLFTKEYNSLNMESYQGDIEYQLGEITISSTTAYTNSHFGTSNNNGGNLPTLVIVLGEHYKQFSQELRASGTTGPFEYLFGGYYQDDTFNIDVFQSFNLVPYGLPIPPFSRFATMDQRSKSYSVFGNLIYNLTDKFDVEVGARYSMVRKSTDQANNPANLISGINFDMPRSVGTAALNPALNGLFTSVLGAIPHTFFGIKNDENHFQPQVILKYRPSSLAMLYAKFVKGDKVGGVDFLYNGSVARGAKTQDAQFRPETATSFEVGLKGVTPGRVFEYGLTAFSTTFDNLQTGIFLGTAVFTTNAGSARTRGLEAELGWNVAPGLKFNGAASYQVGEFLDYRGGACTTAQGNAGACSAATGGQKLTGHRLPFSSQYTASFAADYHRDFGFAVVGANASVIYKSSYNTSLNDDPLADQKGFATVDAGFSISPANTNLTLALFARNLTDQSYKEYGVAEPLIPGGFVVFRSRARQVGMRLSVGF